MKTSILLLISILSFIPKITIAQVGEFDYTPTQLVVHPPNEYVFQNKYKVDRKDNVIKLDQEYYKVDGDDVYFIHESFDSKKDLWSKYRYKEVRYTNEAGEPDYYYQTDGYQIHYDSIGRPTSYNHYIDDQKSQLKRIVEYYPNGQIHFVMEIKDGLYWNVIDYFYPDGKPYDYGSFEEGEGQIIWLDETGNPCLICNMDGKKLIRAKMLCEEESKKKRKRSK